MADEKILSGDGEDGKPLVDDVAIIETDSSGKPIESSAGEDSRIADDGADASDKGEQQRERKRETHQERRERHRKARERDQREMSFLRGYVGKLEEKVNTLQKQTTITQAQSVDQRLSEALNEVDTAERIMAAAVDAKNGTDMVKAQRMRDEARQRAIQLSGERERLQAAPAATPAAVEPPPYLPLAQKFAEDKPWFTWDQSDEDSRTVLQIDNEVAKEGYNPTTPAYWQELERRVQSKLPHRFNGGDEDDDEDEDDQRTRPTTRRGPPVGAGRQHAPPSTRHEAFISPERKAAMQEAGVWDDPVLRRKYAKAYSEWDRNNSARR